MDFIVKGVGQKISKAENEQPKKTSDTFNLPFNEHKSDSPSNQKKQKNTINTFIAEEKKKYESSLINIPELKPQPPEQPQEYFFTSSKPKTFQESHAFENSSAYIDYVPTNDVRELKLEKTWFAIKNKELCMKREQEELNKVMESWGKSKSKYDEEIMRKMECLNDATNFAQRNYPIPIQRQSKTREKLNFQEEYLKESESENGSEELISSPMRPVASLQPQATEPDIVSLQDPVPVIKKVAKPKMAAPKKTQSAARGKKQEAKKQEYIEPPKFIEISNSQHMGEEANKQNIGFIRKLYGPLINATDNKMEKAKNIYETSLHKPICLSLHHKESQKERPRTANMANSGLPSILTNIRSEFVNKQYQDIEHLKETFAKAEIPCSVVTLQNALLMPQPLIPGRMTADCVPAPGSRLLSNPFIKKKKKKKKKKGSKKGKKK